jgi:hypothetical protein
MTIRGRYFVALEDGVVVACVATYCHYRYAVLYSGSSGTFATFHEDAAGARRALRLRRPFPSHKDLTPAIEAVAPVPIGVRFDGRDQLLHRDPGDTCVDCGMRGEHHCVVWCRHETCSLCLDAASETAPIDE